MMKEAPEHQRVVLHGHYFHVEMYNSRALGILVDVTRLKRKDGRVFLRKIAARFLVKENTIVFLLAHRESVMIAYGRQRLSGRVLSLGKKG